MAYTVAVGSIVELTVLGTLYQQRVMNVFHYRIKTLGSNADGHDALFKINDAFEVGGGTNEKLLQCVSVDVGQLTNRLQWITPVRYRAREFSNTETNGLVAVACELPAVSASVEFAGELADRHGIGRKSIFGVPTTAYNDGRPTSTYFTTLSAFAVSAVGNLTTDTGMVLEPVIFNRANPADSRTIVQGGPKNEMRTQRTRIIGRGI